MKSVFRINSDTIAKFFKTYSINWFSALLVVASVVLLLYLKKPLFLFLIMIFLPYVFEKRPARQVQELGEDGRRDRLDTTYLLSNLNPFTIHQVLLQLVGQLYLSIKYKNQYPSPATYENRRVYSLPFEGEWYVANGGIDEETSHSWNVLTQRYAYDFLRYPEGVSTFTADGSRLEHYYCYNQKVVSPANGRVVKTYNKVKDYEGVSSLSIDWKTRDFRGNFVVIQHAPREYSFIAHLKKDSIAVKKGDYVQRGQLIGLCGNSGHSTEPHIHFHLQDGKSMWFSIGLPIKFSRFMIRDVSSLPVPIHQEYIERAYYVSNAAPYS